MDFQGSKKGPAGHEEALAKKTKLASQESLGEEEDPRATDPLDEKELATGSIDATAPTNEELDPTAPTNEELDQIIDDLDLDEILDDENLAEAAARGAAVQAEEDADILAEIAANLAAAQEVEDAENSDDPEAALPDTPVKGPRTFKDDREEILAHLGVDYSTKGSWTDDFISLCEKRENDDYEKPLRKFLADIRVGERAASFLNIYDFLESIYEEWATHDKELDKPWNGMVPTVVGLSKGQIKGQLMTKPSGPLVAVLGCVWDYPSLQSHKLSWGHVMDHTNNCMKAQHRRIGANPFVRTHNRIPVRHPFKKEGIKWDEYLPNWREINAEFVKFSKFLNMRTKIILAIGKENSQSVHDLVDLGDTLEAVKVNIQVNLKVFGKPPYIHIIRNKATKEVKHVVFYTAHSQHFFYERVGFQARAYHDFIWNVACDFAHIKVLHPTYYLRQKETHVHRLSAEQIWQYGLTQFNLAHRLRGHEKRSGVILPKMAVETAFQRTLFKNPSFILEPDINGSFVGAVLRLFIKHSREARTDEWRNSEPGQLWVKSLVNTWKVKSRPKINVWKNEEYRNSTAGQNSLAGLSKGRKNKQIPATVKIDALMRVKQVRDRLSADLDSLTQEETHARERIEGLRNDEGNRRKRWFTYHVVFYSDEYPNGLRYPGDGGPPDNFPYTEMDHPAVRLENGWTTKLKREFALSTAAPSATH